MKSMNLFALGAVAALSLAGCGGDSGGGGDAPPLALSTLQGYWNPPTSTGNISGSAMGTSATRARAVVLDDGKVYVFLHDGTVVGEPLVGLATATVFGIPQGYTGSGKRYPASGSSVADITVSGAAPAANAWTINVTSAGASSTLALAYNNAYDVPAVQADVVGTWHFTKAGGTITADWTVDGAGALTGTSTLGCTYIGSVRPRNATTAVYAVAVTETCTGTVKSLTGIGRLNTTKDFLTFGLTTTNGAEAEAFAAAKQ